MKRLSDKILVAGLGLVNVANKFFGVGGLRKDLILCYHGIDDDNWQYSTSPSDFESHIKYLQKYYKIVPLNEILNSTSDSPRVSITFDDGFEDVYNAALPIMHEHGVVGTIFLTETEINKQNEETYSKKLLTRDIIFEFEKLGWEFGYHTKNHLDLSTLSYSQQKREIGRRPHIEKEFGVKMSYFAYPKGSYNKETIEILKHSEFSYALTTSSGKFNTANKYEIPRLLIERVTSREKCFEPLLSNLGGNFIALYTSVLKIKHYLTIIRKPKILVDNYHIENYKFVRKIRNKENSHVYKYGEYISKSDNRRVFAKIWESKFRDLNYYSLKNEINAYKLLSSSTDTSQNTNNLVSIPELVDVIEEKGRLIMIVSFIDGVPVLGSSPKEKAEYFEDVVKYLRAISLKADQNLKKAIQIRSNLYWITIFPYLVFINVCKNLRDLPLVFRSIFYFVSKIPTLIKNNELTIVHRDLDNWNILISEESLYLIDLQQVCLANHIADHVITCLSMWNEKEFISEYLKTKTFKDTFKSDVNRNIFRALSLVFGLYDLALPNGLTPDTTRDYLLFCLNGKIFTYTK